MIHGLTRSAFSKEEDHYILVMVALAGSQPPYGALDSRPPHDQVKLLITALAIVIVLFCGIFFSIHVPDFINDKYKIDLSKYLPSRNSSSGYLWVAATAIALVMWALGNIFGDNKVDFLGKLFFRRDGASKPKR